MSEKPSEAVLARTEPQRVTPDKRRRQVYNLSTAGYSNVEIAKLLGVHRNTIKNDLKKFRDASIEEVRSGNVQERLAKVVTNLDMVADEAFANYKKCAEDDKQRQVWLKMALDAYKARVDMLLHTGLIPKVKPDLDPKKVHGLTTEKLEKLRNQRLRQLRGVGVVDPSLLREQTFDQPDEN